MVTMAPSIAISTSRWRAANAETMWIAALLPGFRYERRDVFPSIAITSAGTPVSDDTHATKQR